MNCPIVWVSKLQGCIDLFTTEAEYISLSHAMRELIPFTGSVEKLNEIFHKDKLKQIVKKNLKIIMEHWNWQEQQKIDPEPNTLH